MSKDIQAFNSNSSGYTRLMLPLSRLTVDERIQRPLDRFNPVLVAQSRGDFNTDAMGVIIASERPDGTIIILDGQHRKEAAVRNGDDTRLVEVQVHHGLSTQQEAALFRLLNNSAKVSVLDGFRVRLVEEEPVAVGVMDILSSHGWCLPGDLDRTKTPLVALRTAERIYRYAGNGPAVFDSTLYVVTTAWNRTPMSSDGRILGGTGLLLHRYLPHFEVDSGRDRLNRLATHLFKYSGGPEDLIKMAHGLKSTRRGSTVVNAMAELLVDLFNKNLKSDSMLRLPVWRRR